MATRGFWKGYLKLSLVTCPVSLIPAVSSRQKLQLRTISRESANPVRSRFCQSFMGDHTVPPRIIVPPVILALSAFFAYHGEASSGNMRTHPYLLPQCCPGGETSCPNGLLTDRTLNSVAPAPAGKRIDIMDTIVPGFGVRIGDKIEEADKKEESRTNYLHPGGSLSRAARTPHAGRLANTANSRLRMLARKPATGITSSAKVSIPASRKRTSAWLNRKNAMPSRTDERTPLAMSPKSSSSATSPDNDAR